MRFNIVGWGLVFVCGFAIAGWAIADELGDFQATKTCAAVKSIRTGSNPGKIRVKAGKTYPSITLNKEGGDYVQIKIVGANPPQRWVSLDCGSLTGSSIPTPTPPGSSETSRDNLLVLSWQPAFCDIHERDRKSECDSETAGRFDASHFSLHGLWPQPKGNYYCHGVSAKDKSNDADSATWNLLPSPPGLTAATRASLEEAMPGTASGLHRHEWIKHGTCFGANNADAYFRIALALQRQVNDSQLQKFMASHIDKGISSADLARAFEQTFGPGSSAAMKVDCQYDADSRRNLLVEIQFKLKGELTEDTPLGKVLDTSHPETGSCKNAIVDPVGVQ